MLHLKLLTWLTVKDVQLQARHVPSRSTVGYLEESCDNNITEPTALLSPEFKRLSNRRLPINTSLPTPTLSLLARLVNRVITLVGGLHWIQTALSIYYGALYLYVNVAVCNGAMKVVVLAKSSWKKAYFHQYKDICVWSLSVFLMFSLMWSLSDTYDLIYWFDTDFLHNLYTKPFT